MGVGLMLFLKRIWQWWIMSDVKTEEPYFSMSMIGLSNFFARLDPMVQAGVTFSIVGEGVMVNAYIPESQLTNLLVRGDFD